MRREHVSYRWVRCGQTSYGWVRYGQVSCGHGCGGDGELLTGEICTGELWT